MKNLCSISIVTLMLMILSSCETGLEEKPFSSLPPGEVFKDEAGLEKATLGIYRGWSELQDPSITSVFFRFTLGEAGSRYVTNGMGGGLSGVNPFYRFAQTPQEAALNDVWSRYYRIISRANAVIDNAEAALADTAVSNSYLAEARFLRAYAYFCLARDFGGVPLIDRQVLSLEDQDQIYKPRAGLEETYEFILNDLEFAKENLPEARTGNQVGRVTKAAAIALLGKTHLYMAGQPLSLTEHYRDAARELSLLVGPENETIYNISLVPDFEDVFALDNERNNEILLSFSCFTNSANPSGSIYPFYLFPRGLANGDEQTNFGFTYDLYRLFESRDRRRNFTLVARYKFLGADQNGWETGDSIYFDPENRKYRSKRNDVIWGQAAVVNGLAYGKLARSPRPEGTPVQGYDTDLIEIRFSDVLLSLAEALNESGRGPEALSHLNRVRERANASRYRSLGQNQLRTAIRKERRLELTGEFTTVYDIRRWGTLSDEIGAMTPDQVVDNQLNPYNPRLELYPIPQPQLDANPNLTQNSGW